ncbi:DUF305 domain-containing protein [Ilyomonas limi]|uniref:DUF305 domain-containing protein n=1 Tax=Ilyomonas limi TaxID=2575867 RepID=A0A4U3KV09_9BACT|nr:DUF305 domain-containing protein [Ilyomonas limi]TKK66298.1 DUF305 domain-containing protein [Ilyomonas limi]
MQSPILFFRTTAIALVSGIFLLASCQKEQAAGPEQQTLTQSGTAQAVDQMPNIDADMAFDSAAMHIMMNMMQQMNSMHMTCDPDIDFAHMMIMHHEAGIQMADAEIMYGHDAEAKAIAHETREGNMESKHRLQAYLATNPTHHPLSEMECMMFMKQLDKSMQVMMMGMNKASNIKNVDVDFASQMMAHHAGALGMSEVELKWGRDHATLSEASMIIKEQAKEIVELGRFVKQHVGSK